MTIIVIEEMKEMKVIKSWFPEEFLMCLCQVEIDKMEKKLPANKPKVIKMVMILLMILSLVENSKFSQIISSGSGAL
jgi:hypothetical protein